MANFIFCLFFFCFYSFKIYNYNCDDVCHSPPRLLRSGPVVPWYWLQIQYNNNNDKLHDTLNKSVTDFFITAFCFILILIRRITVCFYPSPLPLVALLLSFNKRTIWRVVVVGFLLRSAFPLCLPTTSNINWSLYVKNWQQLKLFHWISITKFSDISLNVSGNTVHL